MTNRQGLAGQHEESRSGGARSSVFVPIVPVCVALYGLFCGSFLLRARGLSLAPDVAATLVLIPAIVVAISRKPDLLSRYGVRRFRLARVQENPGVTAIHALWVATNWHMPALVAVAEGGLGLWSFLWLGAALPALCGGLELSDERPLVAGFLIGATTTVAIAVSLPAYWHQLSPPMSWATLAVLVAADALVCLWLVWHSGYAKRAAGAAAYRPE